jgi:hypothetical protein
MSARSIYNKNTRINNMDEPYSTKKDLHQFESRLEGKIIELKVDVHKAGLRLEGKINELKYDLIKWMVSLWVAQTALFLTLFLRK